ncbi:hypothetical protein [Staphylococcus epidermidis]|uniref:hypothetical protein n=1 Tax=Staphylococcus epidermidis TaxID=1282 RepID=UPI001C402E8A|nr:hypothetical protein [Staphylococcus epidermidis]
MFNVTRSMIDKAIEIVSKETNSDYLKGDECYLMPIYYVGTMNVKNYLFEYKTYQNPDEIQERYFSVEELTED